MDFALGAAGTIIIYLIIQLLIGGLFMYLGASIAGVQNNSFGKGIIGFIVSLIIMGLLVFIFTLIFFFFPPLGSLIGFLIGMLITAAILKGIYSTSFGKGFVTLLMAWILNVVVFFLLSLIFATFFASLIGELPISY